jgi:NCS1 family nucleobase:cation symporter-1
MKTRRIREPKRTPCNALLIAAVWFGIQVHIGAGALLSLVRVAVPGVQAWNETKILDLGVASWLSFAVFLGLNLMVLRHGMETLRRFELWAAPIVMVFAVGLCGWSVSAAGGLGPIVSAAPSQSADLTRLVPQALTAIIGFWSTLALNAPDFTRFARSQRDQMIGQAIGLPTTMVAFSVLAVFTTSATSVLFGKVMWDPLEIVARLPSPPLAVASLIAILVATVSVNVPANLVSPAYDFANLAPQKITMWRGALIAAALATAILPWRLLSTAGSYVFTWLNTSADLLGPVAGVMIADYWFVRRRELSVPDLYRTDGLYRYAGGFNPRALIALAVGIGVSLAGRWFEPLRLLADLGWTTGFLVGGAVYGALASISSRDR